MQVNYTTIGLDHVLLPILQQIITWTNADIFLIRQSGTNHSKILIKIQ